MCHSIMPVQTAIEAAVQTGKKIKGLRQKKIIDKKARKAYLREGIS